MDPSDSTIEEITLLSELLPNTSLEGVLAFLITGGGIITLPEITS